MKTQERPQVRRLPSPPHRRFTLVGLSIGKNGKDGVFLTMHVRNSRGNYEALTVLIPDGSKELLKQLHDGVVIELNRK